MIIGVTNAAKATGATTVALGLAAAAAADGVASLVIEADVSGGDVAYWRMLKADEAGVLGFAAAAGADTDLDTTIGQHVWSSPGTPGCSVMPLEAGGIGIQGQVAALWQDGRSVLERWPGLVVLDLGRFEGATCRGIWSELDAGVVLCPGSLAGLQRVDKVKDQAPLRNDFGTWTILNGSAWSLADVAADTGLRFDVVFEWDRRCAEAIRLGNWKAAKRRLLGRQLTELATDITKDLVEVTA